mmetsp:Transcript_48268/g.114410  ORF Transcript_48268/g.114410 Transcript_48268/m.114410 type:complete len:278 (-) Transcript_48268:63-896(-)
MPLRGALGLEDLGACDFGERLRGAGALDVVRHELDDIAGSAAAIVVDGLLVALGPGLEEFDGGVALHAVCRSQTRLLRRVHHPQLELPFQLPGSILPLWLQALAVPAPRRHELDEPVLIAVEHFALEVCLCQLDRSVLPSSSSSSALAPAARRGRLPAQLLCDLVGEHLEGMLRNRRCGALSLVVDRLFLVCAEELDSREALNLVLASQLLVLISVHLSDLDRGRDRPCKLRPIREQCLAVSTPRGVEQDSPDIVAVQHLLLEVRRTKLLAFLSSRA